MIKPGLTVHRLERFLAVMDHGGVGRAAQACHISQPAVSEHLRGLEAHFGVRLVERHGQRVRPTAAARVVEPYARQALALLRTAGQAAGEVRGLRAGSLTIGASTTPGTYLLPAALGRFHATYPGSTLRRGISDTRGIERSVAVGQLELGVIGEAPLVRGLAAEPWVKDELVLIVSRGHPFARRRSVPAHAIAGESYIAREEGSSTRGVAERYLTRLGVTLTAAMELGSTEAIREAVAAGLGVALVSRHAVLARDRRIVAARLAEPGPLEPPEPFGGVQPVDGRGAFQHVRCLRPPAACFKELGRHDPIGQTRADGVRQFDESAQGSGSVVARERDIGLTGSRPVQCP